MPMLEDGKVTTNRGMLAYSREGAYRIIVLRFFCTSCLPWLYYLLILMNQNQSTALTNKLLFCLFEEKQRH